ncbi:chorismate mutase [Aquibacillus kalidii]|uniref:chorismate mutase n=1 Tax=Aquibacillus kalidii TaxID=2762597 RepID=UPI00164607A0|nr:chorismate mutase [Aquibacillus kalidii]
MIRGIRGATTVEINDESMMVERTKVLLEEMVSENRIQPEEIATVLISVTADINATFPAKALRLIDGWTYVPVMCMKEIDVPGSLEKCIRVMMTVNTDNTQKEIKHIYHYEAKKLRPDLSKKS